MCLLFIDSTMLSRIKWLEKAHSNIWRAQIAKQHCKSLSTYEEKFGASRTQGHMPHLIHQREYRFAEGKVYNGFQCERVEHITDFDLTSYTLRHEGTGTELWHIDRKDANNVFSINFRTTPFDSTGLPHILEHLVLCGSKNYPVRDPFLKCLTVPLQRL